MLVSGSELVLVVSALVLGEVLSGGDTTPVSACFGEFGPAMVDLSAAAATRFTVCKGFVLSLEELPVLSEAPAAASAIPASNCSVLPGELGTELDGLRAPTAA